MARPKEFDPERALARVMELFWAKGYEATSMEELVEASGVGRQSLYNEFGGKRDLYLKALDLFASRDGAALMPLLAEKGRVRDVLRRTFDEVVDRATKDKEARGCMLANAATELACSDPDVKRRVGAATDLLERAIERRLADARRAGEIPKRHDPVALARFFAATIIAIRTMSKTSRERSRLASIADVALSVLD